MKTLTLLLGSLAASIAFGGAFAQVFAPQGGYNSPPAYGASINPPGAEGRSATRPRYPYHHSGTRGRLGRGANPRHPEGPGNPRD
jgi:hypothetical protein